MKKLISVVLSASMALSMAVAPAVPAFAESTEAASEVELPDGSNFSIGLVTDVGGVNDGSFNQSAWEGLQKAGEDMGVTVNYLESKTDADYAPNIESFVDDGTDLIICVGYMLADAMKESAEDNPDQKYAIIDDATNADLPNVTCLMFHQEQASYLVGYVAGLVTKTNTIGFVLGMSTETMNQFGYGYLAGAIDANPDVKVLQYNANSFADSATGKSDANTAITNGADIVFHAAGATGLGVIEACQEAGVWAIGVDSDQSPIAPKTILTSAMKRVDNAVYEATLETVKGTIQSGVKEFDLSIGGVDIAPTTDNIPEDVLTKVEDVKKQIIAGDIVVPTTKDEFEAKYGDVYELD